MSTADYTSEAILQAVKETTKSINEMMSLYGVSYHQVLYQIYRSRIKAVKVGPTWRILPPFPLTWKDVTKLEA